MISRLEETRLIRLCGRAGLTSLSGDVSTQLHSLPAAHVSRLQLAVLMR
jgi:hypothetical protein